jgi:hypothetical protein
MERLNLTIEIQPNSIGARRANVRGNLQVANLITTIQDKFNLDGTFELRLKGDRQTLPGAAGLNQVGVVDGSVLVCSRLVEDTGIQDAIRMGERHRFSKKFRRVFLQEETRRIEYELYWQPAIIGRKDRKSPFNNRLLAADLEDAEESPSVSRHHTAITESDGQFYIESLNERNLTILNGSKIRPGTRHPLPTGSAVQVGNLTLIFQSIL